MAAVRKFLFENDLEVIKKPVEVVEEVVKEEAEPEEVEPSFKDYHLEISYDVGFESGRDKGIMEAANSIESKVSETLTKMLESLPKVFEDQKRDNETTMHNAMMASLAVSRKVLPKLAELNALGEVERMVQMTLEKVIEEPQVVVRVNEKLRDRMAECIESLVKAGGFEGKLILQGDSSLPLGDCRIEWGSGGAERDMNDLWREIDGIIERNLGEVLEGSPPIEEISGEIPIEANADTEKAFEEGAVEAAAEDAVVEEDTGGDASAVEESSAEAPLEAEEAAEDAVINPSGGQELGSVAENVAEDTPEEIVNVDELGTSSEAEDD